MYFISLCTKNLRNTHACPLSRNALQNTILLLEQNQYILNSIEAKGRAGVGNKVDMDTNSLLLLLQKPKQK